MIIELVFVASVGFLLDGPTGIALSLVIYYPCLILLKIILELMK